MMSSVALVFTTMERPHVAERLIMSARRYCPDVPIYVAEQGDTYSSSLGELCLAEHVTHLRLPRDVGLPAARNTLVRSLREPYFILADDDFEFVARPGFDLCVRFLEQNADFLCVGGDLDDFIVTAAGYSARSISRTNNLALDRSGKGVILIPMGFVPPAPIVFEGEEFHRCDYVANWGVFRRSAFVDNDLWWDENIAIGGEHLDFFLQVKLHHQSLSVAFWRGLRCNHVEDRTVDYESFRSRRDWVDYFSRKWDLLYYSELGGALRYYDSYYSGDVIPDTKLGRSLRKAQSDVEWHRRRLLDLRERHDELRARYAALKTDRKAR